MIKRFTKLTLSLNLLLFIGLSNVFALKPLPSPPPGTNYYTIMSGDLIANIWSLTSHAGATCSCTPDGTCAFDVPANATLYIAHAVTTGCNISIGNNATIIIENGGSLTVTGNASISGTGFFQVDAGGSAVVTGNFTVTGTGDATINGSLAVGGNLTLTSGAGSNICGGGTISVVGSVTGAPDPCFSGSLPIELLYFKGDLNKAVVDLTWATTSETNNDYFTVQRSVDGITWSNLMLISGAGNSNMLLEYGRTDTNPLTGTSYYKLKQTDYDGNSSESQIVVIQNNNASSIDIIPFPNPNEGSTIGLEVLGFDGEEVEITLTNILGDVIYTKVYPVTGNNHRLTLELSNTLPCGTYFVTGRTSNNSISKKILIK